METIILDEQKIVDLTSILEYDDREWPEWRGNIGHFNVDGDAIIIRCSYADHHRAGCNAERLSVKPGRKGGVSLRGYDDRGNSIGNDFPNVDMSVAVQCVWEKAKAGTRLISDFNSAISVLASAAGDGY